jgi:hypothetical protein
MMSAAGLVDNGIAANTFIKISQGSFGDGALGDTHAEFP